MALRVITAGILLGLAAGAVVLAVVPPAAEVAQTHHVPGVPTTVLAAAPGLDADASALLGGQPDAAGIADAVEVVPGDGTLDVRARADTPGEAAVVVEAVGTVLDRRAASSRSSDGAPVRTARSTVGVTTDPPRDVGLRPAPAAVLGAGGALGLLAGLVAAGLRGRGVSSSEALARHAGRPVLGLVPAPRRTPRDPAVLSPVPDRARRRHPVRRRDRAVRDLADAVRAEATAARVVVVLAVEPQATTVSVATDLAVALAADGERVLLVESGPGSAASPVARVADPTPGVREVIAGAAHLDRAVQRWSRAGIDVLPAGTAAQRGAAPLDGADVARVLGSLRGRYDRIVVDAPGEPGARPAVELGRSGDAVVLVVRRGTPVVDLTTMLEALDGAGVEVRGTVLSGAG